MAFYIARSFDYIMAQRLYPKDIYFSLKTRISGGTRNGRLGHRGPKTPRGGGHLKQLSLYTKIAQQATGGVGLMHIRLDC